jgi:hypothetical protein
MNLGTDVCRLASVAAVPEMNVSPSKSEGVFGTGIDFCQGKQR